MSISGALSIPFIVVAFQQERISNWWKNVTKAQPSSWLKNALSTQEPSWWKNVPWALLFIWIGAIIVVALGIVLPIALIWTRPLASGVKTAVTIALLFVGASFVIGYGIYRLVSLPSSGTGSTTSGSSSSLRDD